MQIDIGSVLRKFDDTYDEVDMNVKEYGIRLITTDGRLRTMRCRKNVIAPKMQLRKPIDAKGKTMFNLKRNGTMLVHDLDIDEPRSVKVFAISHFKDFKQTEWATVKH